MEGRIFRGERWRGKLGILNDPWGKQPLQGIISQGGRILDLKSSFPVVLWTLNKVLGDKVVYFCENSMEDFLGAYLKERQL